MNGQQAGSTPAASSEGASREKAMSDKVYEVSADWKAKAFIDQAKSKEM